MNAKKRNIGFWLIIGIVVLSYTGIMNKTIDAEPQAISSTPYQYKSCDGDVCEMKFIPCTTNDQCVEVCLGDTTYRWIADASKEYLNQTFMADSSYYLNDIKGGYCSGGHCYVSEYCVYSGAIKEYILQHPWAWVQQNPIFALAIIAGIVVFLLI